MADHCKCPHCHQLLEIEKVVEATQYDGCPAEDNIIAYCPNCRNTFSINARNTFFIKE